tara:strand:+ start:7421 stop:9901 length:2481 start_codon:yes stop_codon:yes gene_type:complete
MKDFKNIEEKKGYRVDKKDREIFEREVRRGIFGLDVGDLIEFILYDSNDNALPQESSNGKLVRYISYTDSNIKKYFSKADKTKFNLKRNKAEEFFIDVEKLIKEAGYSQGVFKTSVALLNRRLGSEDRMFDRAWIHEISPSRTEVRVLPVIDESTGQPNEDLDLRYQTFTSGDDFFADIVLFLDEFSEQFDVASIVTKMLQLRGKVADGKNYIKLIEKEFKIDNFERFLSLVKLSFDKSMDNFRNNRYFNIKDQSTFGQPTGDKFGVNFNSKGIIKQLCDIAENCVDYHLPNQDFQKTIKTRAQQETLDKVDKILRTVKSDGEFYAESPTEKKPAIRGCRDPKAKNYNKLATVDDKCTYSIQVTKYRKVPVPPPPPPPKPIPVPIPKPRPKPSGGGSPPSPTGGSCSSYKSGMSIHITSGDRSFTKGAQTRLQGGYVFWNGDHFKSPARSKCRGKVGVSCSPPSWCSVNGDSTGTGFGGTLTLGVQENTGPTRTGSFTCRGTGDASGLSASITFTQAGVAKPPPKKVCPAAGTIIKDTCAGTTRAVAYADGNCGVKSNMPTMTKNSPKCGYTKPKGGGGSSGGGFGSGGGGGCLVADTKIEAADGTMINVQDIKVGQSIKGLDIKTLSSWNKVEDNWKGKDIEKYDYSEFKVIDFQHLTDRAVYSINDGLLECSEEHKHLIKRDDEWQIKTTLELELGDIFLTREKEEIELNSMFLVREDDVFLLTLDGKHTYYANGILTHNFKANFESYTKMTFSDRRLKKNINKIGESLSGLNIYSFEYKDTKYGDGVFQGVMSDEIPQSAVIRDISGYDMVDYSKIDVNFKEQ